MLFTVRVLFDTLIRVGWFCGALVRADLALGVALSIAGGAPPSCDASALASSPMHIQELAHMSSATTWDVPLSSV